jgi:hypothetical protein
VTQQALVEAQVVNNGHSAGSWDLYAPHRRRLTELVAASARGRDLVVLGAGNGNDLNLPTLARRFQEIHLADLDPAALGRAVRRQDAATRARLVVHGGRDLSGLLACLPEWRVRAPDVEALARETLAAGARVAAGFGRRFDVVVSDCLISQVAWTCYRALGDGPLLMSVLDVALAAHLRALVALARPGGRCLLVTDVVSSDTHAVERLASSAGGEALLASLEAERALFSGTSPSAARFILSEDPTLAAQVEGVSLLEPWAWPVSRSRAVLVYALAFTRRS